MGSLKQAFVQRTPEGFRIQFQAAGQALAPWYEIVAER